MNPKFFDIKKEKQDRIINAALKVIALRGFSHASTDEIVKEAGISKGLLFHYFENKQGLLDYLYGYSTRYALMELKGQLRETSPDFFEFHEQVLQAEISLIKQYPCIMLFLEHMWVDKDDEVLALDKSKLNSFSEFYQELLQRIHFPEKIMRSDVTQSSRMIYSTKFCVQRYMLFTNHFSPETYENEVRACISYLKTLSEN